MSRHEMAERYEAAIRQLREYIRRNEDGTLRLDIDDAQSLGIDPVVFADLKRSLEETNRLIRNGVMRGEDVKV